MKPTYGKVAPSVLSPHPGNAFGEYGFSPRQPLELLAEVEINRKSQLLVQRGRSFLPVPFIRGGSRREGKQGENFY
jgi:hypothetical protein